MGVQTALRFRVEARLHLPEFSSVKPVGVEAVGSLEYVMCLLHFGNVVIIERYGYERDGLMVILDAGLVLKALRQIAMHPECRSGDVAEWARYARALQRIETACVCNRMPALRYPRFR